MVASETFFYIRENWSSIDVNLKVKMAMPYGLSTYNSSTHQSSTEVESQESAWLKTPNIARKQKRHSSTRTRWKRKATKVAGSQKRVSVSVWRQFPQNVSVLGPLCSSCRLECNRKAPLAQRKVLLNKS